MEQLHRGSDHGGSSSETAASAPEPAAPGRGSSPAHAGGTIWRKAVVTTRGAEGDAPRDHFAAATQGASSEVPFRAEMERSFGHDFSGVQAYLGRSVPMAAIGAEAATRGEQIAFATATPGRDLVAHELTHVVQSRQHGGGGVQLKDAVSSPSHAAEHEADAVAERVVRGERVTVGAAPSAEVARRGPCYTARDRVEELKALGLLPHAPLVVLDESGGGSIDKVELKRRAEHRELVQVRYTPVGGKQVNTKIPADLLDVDTYFMSPEDIKDNPDNGPHSQSTFPVPRAISMDGENLVVKIDLQSRNRWDRAAWEIELGGKRRLLAEDRSWWNNPEWHADEMNEHSFHAYQFHEGFKTLEPHGRGQIGYDREIYARIPMSEIKETFGQDFKESSPIYVGMKIRYDANRSPATANEDEFKRVFGFAGQVHNWGSTRNDLIGGKVNLAGLGLAQGDWAKDEDIWKQSLPSNPLPNLLRPFPGEHLSRPEMVPLIPTPKEGKKPAPPELATRIENEATLKLSSLDKLHDLVGLLQGLVGNNNAVNEIMQKGRDPLSQFQWSLHAENDGAPMVFTDKYLDDPGLHALRSGVGIRRRHTTKATKLNVKTGEGHRVGLLRKHSPEPGDYSERDDKKSNIYRRHEIGFDLNEDATPEHIGRYLESGVGGRDPWNKSGDEANKTVGEHLRGETIDYSQLGYRMVLQGHRTKFKLSATSKEGAVINIEISCDHTAGRSFKDYESEGGDGVDPMGVFKRTESNVKHIYNIEMELEHLGAGNTKSTEGESKSIESPPMPSSSTGERGPQKKGEPESVPQKPPPPGHPGRMYLRDDTHAPEFNTPSFQVFYHAQRRFVDFARNEAPMGNTTGIGPKELSKGRQKLESLFEKLDIQPEESKSQVPEMLSEPEWQSPSQPKILMMGSESMGSEMPSSSVKQYTPTRGMQTQLKLRSLGVIPLPPDGDCLYRAVIATANLGYSIQQLRNLVADEVASKKGYYKRFLHGQNIDTVIANIRTMGAYAGVDGDFAPEIVGLICKLQISILSEGGVTTLQGSGTAITLVRYTGGGGADHFDGTRPL